LQLTVDSFHRRLCNRNRQLTHYFVTAENVTRTRIVVSQMTGSLAA